MTVADYILAAIGLLGCLAWAVGSFFVASIDAFAPVPCAETARTGRQGCASLIVALVAFAWFAGVLWNGNWGWLP